jgi:hypothetical protein
VPSLALTDIVSVSFNATNVVRSHFGTLGAQLTSPYFQSISFPVSIHPTVPQNCIRGLFLFCPTHTQRSSQ